MEGVLIAQAVNAWLMCLERSSGVLERCKGSPDPGRISPRKAGGTPAALKFIL